MERQSACAVGNWRAIREMAQGLAASSGGSKPTDAQKNDGAQGEKKAEESCRCGEKGEERRAFFLGIWGYSGFSARAYFPHSKQREGMPYGILRIKESGIDPIVLILIELLGGRPAPFTYFALIMNWAQPSLFWSGLGAIWGGKEGFRISVLVGHSAIDTLFPPVVSRVLAYAEASSYIP